VFRHLALQLAVPLLLAASGGCTLLQDVATRMPGPRLYEKGAALIDGIRTFEQRIDFRPTDNFRDLDKETESYPFCGIVPSFHLPYSYEDPAIRWVDIPTAEDCRRLAGPGGDAYFGQSEAVGEMGTPVTTAMMSGSLVRFVYLVFHEDCHDQFDLPFGIEEALCNVIAYHAMDQYAGEKDRFSALERVALKRYSVREPERTRQARAFYEQLEALYARHARQELPAGALLEERARIFARAERALAWETGSLNNVGIANDMTYSRHFPLLEGVFIALDRDLARTVAFFRQVDAKKPSRAGVVKRYGLKSDRGVEFIRANEAAVVETIEKMLAEAVKK
jgi:hypothetical protein